MISLSKLRHLVALADAGNFTRAAERLGMAQPSLSRSIADLERQCGLRLFDRMRLGVTPTAAGTDLILDARQILGRVTAVEQNLERLGRGEAGRIAFGLGPLASSWLLNDLLVRCLKQWSALSLSTTIDSTGELVRKVLDGELDFCVCGSNYADPAQLLAARRITSVPMGYFVRRGHPLTVVTRPLQWADLAGWPLAAGSVPETAEHVIPPLFGPFRTTVECNDYDVLKRTTLESNAIWLTSEILVRDELASGRMVEIQPDPDAIAIVADMLLVRLAGRSVSPVAGQIMDVVVRMMQAGGVPDRQVTPDGGRR